MNLNRRIDAIYVYYDVIQTKLVGDSCVPPLRVIPIRGVIGEMAFKEYYSPMYTPLAKYVFSTIGMYITDSTGRPVPFSLKNVVQQETYKNKNKVKRRTRTVNKRIRKSDVFGAI